MNRGSRAEQHQTVGGSRFAVCGSPATASTALTVSVMLRLIALAILGYIKGHFTRAAPLRSAMQTVLIGGLAATAAFVIARAIA
jgi:VIT1/CCC1 family predicted Fe2+/Mn2+ transporter